MLHDIDIVNLNTFKVIAFRTLDFQYLKTLITDSVTNENIVRLEMEYVCFTIQRI